MTTAIRRSLMAAGLIRPQPAPREIKAVRRSDCLTQRDVLAQKTDAALGILAAAVQRAQERRSGQAHTQAA